MDNLRCKVCGSSTIIKKGEIYECNVCGSQDFIVLDKTPVKQKKGLSKLKVIEIKEEARELHVAGRYRDEIKLLLSAIDMADDQHSALYVSLGRVYRTLSMVDEAIECYEKAIEINPCEGQAYNSLGVIYTLREEYVKANEYFEFGLRFMDKANGDYWIALANHAIVVAKLGNRTKAKYMIFEAELHGYQNAENVRKLAGLYDEDSLIAKVNGFFTKK